MIRLCRSTVMELFNQQVVEVSFDTPDNLIYNKRGLRLNVALSEDINDKLYDTANIF